MVDLAAGSSGGPIEWNFNNYIFLVAGLLVFSVVGLFSYKLVQSLKEKERKREEKRKLKEMKKKK